MNDEHKTTNFDPLKTIAGMVLSPFRLPPAARPLLDREQRRATRKLEKQTRKLERKAAKTAKGANDAKAGIKDKVKAGIGKAVDVVQPFIPSPGEKSGKGKAEKSPWDRASQAIKAGVPGTPDGGPPAPEKGTAFLLGTPGFDMVADGKRRARGVKRKDRKRQLVEIGLHLWRYGMARGVFCALLLLGAVFLPALVPPSWVPADVARDTAPWFLTGPLAEHYAFGSLAAVGLVLLGSLILPGVLRGLVLFAVGCAPFAVYAVAKFDLVAGWGVPTPPPGLEGHTDLVLLLFPAWVALGAGMVAGQNFPDALPGRLLAGVGGIVVLCQQVLASGVLRQSIETRIVAIEGAIAILLLAMTLTAIGQVLKGSMAVCISFVKAGMLLLVGLPIILVVWQWAGPETERMANDVWFEAFRSLIFVSVCYLIAVVGLTEWLHRLAWRKEIRNKLGGRFARMYPASQEFAGQFIEYAHQSGVYSADEMAGIRRQLEHRLRAARR